MERYRRLNLTEREELSRMLAAGSRTYLKNFLPFVRGGWEG